MTIKNTNNYLQHLKKQKVIQQQLTKEKTNTYITQNLHHGTGTLYNRPNICKKSIKMIDEKMIKLGHMEIEESVINIFKYYTKVYCVLSKQNVMYYYGNKNSYYLNPQNIKGFINLLSCILKKTDIQNDQLIIETFTPSHRIYKFKCKTQKERDEWYNAINNLK
eukprot:80474_1